MPALAVCNKMFSQLNMAEILNVYQWTPNQLTFQAVSAGKWQQNWAIVLKMAFSAGNVDSCQSHAQHLYSIEWKFMDE